MIQTYIANPTAVTDYAQAEALRLFTACGFENRGLTLSLAVDPDQETAVRVHTDGSLASLSGRDDASLLHCVYCFFEKLGCSFSFSGETARADTFAGDAWPAVGIDVEPSMPCRGIRMHLNFVQDQSCFTEPAFASFIDNIARMKMNYLMFHMYNGQEWYPFAYRGVEHLELSVGNLERRPLDPGMIGRDKVQVREHWFPADLEHIRDARELRDAMHGRYARMMRRAKERGIRVAASIEPEALPEAFEKALDAWETQEEARADKLVDDWQMGWSGKKVVAGDLRSPVMLDIAVERCLALMEAYPDLDELQLISREGTAWTPGDPAEYAREAERLAARFGFPSSYIDLADCAKAAPEDESEPPMNARAHPYWTVLPGDTYQATVFGALRFAEFAVDILRDPRVAEKAAARGVRLTVAIYSPNPETVRLMSPGVAAILPLDTPISYLADYGARDICDGMDNWRPLTDRGLETGLISWLEFDGCMALAQAWPHSVYDNVRKALSMGVRAACFNHWRVRSLEHSAKMAAEACFDASRTFEAITDEIAAACYGEEASGAVSEAYAALERATLYAKAYNYNIGFTNDWVYAHATNPPGYAWQRLTASRDHFLAAERAFRGLEAASAPRGRAEAAYMADLCLISAKHVEAVYHLQNAKLPLVGFGAWPIENPKAVWPCAALLSALLPSARKALALEEEYMRVYAAHVKDCDEQGQLSMHHQGVIERFAGLARALEARLAEANVHMQME